RARYIGEQYRRRRLFDNRSDQRRGVRLDFLQQCPRTFPAHQGAVPSDQRIWAGDQHLLDRLAPRRPRFHRLLHGQGGGGDVHAHAGEGSRAARHHRQFGGARLYFGRDQCACRRGSRDEQGCDRQHRAQALRAAGGGCRLRPCPRLACGPLDYRPEHRCEWGIQALGECPMASENSMECIAEELAFPEGPVVMADGSVIVVELMGGQITRCWNGRKEVICTTGGGPNGAAIGPDGALWLCNNGGLYQTGPGTKGRIERIDLATGRLERVYDACDGIALEAPNDLVFGADGRLWFTDLGTIGPNGKAFGGLYCSLADGRA